MIKVMLALIATVASACGSDVAATGCAYDLDCRGDRICEDSRCVPAPEGIFEGEQRDAGANDSDGEGEPGAECDNDAPCSGDALCEVGQCRSVCNENDDCGAGETCEPRSDNPGRVCLPGFRCEDRDETTEAECTTVWRCTDGSDRALQCERQGGNGVRCSCLESSRETAEFNWDDTACQWHLAAEIAHNLCGWQEVGP